MKMRADFGAAVARQENGGRRAEPGIALAGGEDLHFLRRAVGRLQGHVEPLVLEEAEMAFGIKKERASDVVAVCWPNISVKGSAACAGLPISMTQHMAAIATSPARIFFMTIFPPMNALLCCVLSLKTN